MAVSALVLAGVAPVASAAQVSGATISGDAGTAVVGGTLYAKQGATLTMDVATDGDTQCVTVSEGATVVATKSGPASTSWKFTTAAFPALVPTAGDRVVTYTFTAYKGINPQLKCTGNAGETVRSVSYVLDNTGPVATPAFSPPLTGSWTNKDTTVTWTATDPNVAVGPPVVPGSGFATLPASTTYTTSGVHTLAVPGFTDRVGNAATGGGTLRIDKAAPSITGSRNPAPNALGWNNSPVTVSFNCLDLPAPPPTPAWPPQGAPAPPSSAAPLTPRRT